MKIVQRLIYLVLIILASVIGCIVGAIFGLIVGPTQLISWVNTEETTKTSDTI